MSNDIRTDPLTSPSTRRKKSLIDTIFTPYPFRRFSSTENLCTIKREVHLMDDRCVTIAFTPKTLGSAVLREVCRYLNVMDTMSYFGIRYIGNNDLIEWVNLDKQLYKQVKDLKDELLRMRVSFYPPNPLSVFKDSTSKFLFYLQLRRDFYTGRLRTYSQATYDLAAYAIQADHGLSSIPDGFDIVNIPGGLRILPNIPAEVVSRIRQHLEPILGISKEQAIDEFILRASKVETYGMEPFQVMDQFDNGLCIGFNHLGISAFKNGQRTDVFSWQQIREVERSGKYLVIVIPRGQCEVRLGFKAHSNAEAKLLWKRAVATRNCANSKHSFESKCGKVDDFGGLCVINPQINPDDDSEYSETSSGDSRENSNTPERGSVPTISSKNLLDVPRPSIPMLPPLVRRSPKKLPPLANKGRSGSIDLRSVISLDMIPMVYQNNDQASCHNITLSSLNINKTGGMNKEV